MADLSWLKVSEYQEASVYEPLPSGEYQIIMVGSEYVTTKKGDGQMLALTFEITDGKYKGRQIRDWINTHNPSEIAVKIGRETVSTIAKCVGVLEPQDASEFHNRIFYCSLCVKPDWNGVPRNRVEKYFQKWTEPHAPKTAELKKPTKVAGPPEPKADDIPF